mgnify:CR=1 FL=1
MNHYVQKILLEDGLGKQVNFIDINIKILGKLKSGSLVPWEI